MELMFSAYFKTIRNRSVVLVTFRMWTQLSKCQLCMNLHASNGFLIVKLKQLYVSHSTIEYFIGVLLVGLVK